MWVMYFITTTVAYYQSLSFTSRFGVDGLLENVMNKGRSYLKMCCLLLGYTILTQAFALGTAGSFMILGLTTNGCWQSENQFDDREQDWIVRNLGTSKAWHASGRAISSSPYSRRKKEVLLKSLRRILDDRVGYLVEWVRRVGVFLRKLTHQLL